MDVVGLLLDVGPSMGHEDHDATSCLSKCKDILSLIIQRKIFSQSEDKLCLFTFGSEGTANELADDGDYEHITMERDVRSADWDLCNHIQNKIEATNHQADFMDALIVVSTYLMNYLNSVNDKKVQKKLEQGRRVIMVFSNLDNPVRSDSSELNGIIEGFKENQFEIHFIGPTGLSTDTDGDDDEPGTSTGANNRPSNEDRHSKPKTHNQLKSESIVQQIVSAIDGCAYDFREALAAASVFESKKKNSMAWSPDLVIGSSLRIPISGYKLVTREAPPSFKRCSIRNPDETIERKYDTFLPDDTNTEVDKEQIIKGYRYGTDLVPFTEDDMANMKYKCDTREFSVIGFTKSTNIKRHYYAGKDTTLIAAKKQDETAATALSALSQAMQETQTVAVVRKVYSARSSPSIGALIPATEGDRQLLYFVELPFMEDVRELEFPSLPIQSSDGASTSKDAPTEDQLSAVDTLIDAMDVSAHPEDHDPLERSNLPNPTLQRLYQVLAARAVSGSCPIPDVAPSISNIVNNAVYASRWTGRDQETFSTLFKLEKNAKAAKSDGANLYKDSNVADNAGATDGAGSGDAADNSTKLKDLNQVPITEVGTIDPVSDFRAMLRQPKLVIKAYTNMAERISQLVSDSVGNTLYDKALQCLKTLRSEAVTEDDKEIIKVVNDFMLSLKSLLTTKGPEEFWKLIVQGDISLIDQNEASSSDVSSNDKESYLAAAEDNIKDDGNMAMEDDEDLLDMI